MTLAGGAKDREWENHKYKSRHRNKDGKWVYDTDNNFQETSTTNNTFKPGLRVVRKNNQEEVPMTEENSSNGSTFKPGLRVVRKNNQEEVPMTEEKLSDSGARATIEKGSNYIEKLNKLKMAYLNR